MVDKNRPASYSWNMSRCCHRAAVQRQAPLATPTLTAQPKTRCGGREVAHDERQCFSTSLPCAVAAPHLPGPAGKQVEGTALGSLLCFCVGVSPAACSNITNAADACDNVFLSS